MGAGTGTVERHHTVAAVGGDSLMRLRALIATSCGVPDYILLALVRSE